MKKISGILAKRNKVDKQDDIFTDKALREMADFNSSRFKLNPVILNEFRLDSPIGSVTDMIYKDGELTASILLMKGMTVKKLKDKIFRCWGSVTKSVKKGNIRKILGFDILGIGMVSKDKDIY